MKKILLLVALATIFSLSGFAQNKDIPFGHNELIEVTLNYKWGISADIAVINFNIKEMVEAGKPCYHLVVKANTNKFFDSFYKVRDVYESKFEVEDLDPIFFRRDIHEGNYFATNHYTLSADKMKLHAKVTKSTRPPVDTIFDTGENIRDLLNAVYHMRSLDFNALMEGESVPYVLALDRNILDVKFRFVCCEDKKVGNLGAFKTVCFALDIQQRSGDDPSKETKAFVVDKSKSVTAYVWMSDDKNHIPLFISTPISVGKLEVRASRLENLKYPLTSKIN